MLNRLDLRGFGSDVASRLPRPTLDGSEPVEAVREIIADVKTRGDDALVELTKKFDGVDLASLRVAPEELDAALSRISDELRIALQTAVANVEVFHEHQRRKPETIDRNGVVRLVKVGSGAANAEAIEAMIKDLLDEAAE